MIPNMMDLDERESFRVALRRIEECRQARNWSMQLDLSGLGLTTLPPEIGELTTLRDLRLSDNRLMTLPPEIGRLTALTTLELRNNQFKTLPPQICELIALRMLDLSGNFLVTLLPEMVRLTALTELYLHFNWELDLPLEVLGPSWQDVRRSQQSQPASPKVIMDYVFARKNQGKTSMQEMRLLIVGRGRSGKTSLLKVLRRQRADEYEPETPGITVLPLELKCARGTVRAHAWDFGGQEFLHGTHQIFLSERCVYLLVLDGRGSDWELETDYWLRFIKSYGGDSPVLLALNKYDAHAFSVDRFRLQELCPQIVGFVETDAFTGRGIDKLRELLEQTANRMGHVWTGVPAKWHDVKEALTQMPECFLDYRDYQALCKRLGVPDAGSQMSLAETLHRLGLALNFRDHPRLRETSVLKPQWVTEAIYGLMRFAHKKDCHGVIEQAWIGEALKGVSDASRSSGDPALFVDYPADKHGFVMELMEKFEVAFALEKTDLEAGGSGQQRWLIPELLPEVQPTKFPEFRAARVKRLRFTYPQALPPGLLPRLIVRTHQMSEANPDWRWRSGVVLEWNGARALVRLDRHERRTEVAVIADVDKVERSFLGSFLQHIREFKGNEPEFDTELKNRQSLFDIVRAHLKVLHGNVSVFEEVQVLGDPEKWVQMTDLRVAEQEQETILPVTVGSGVEAKRVKLPVVPTLNAVGSLEARLAESIEAPERMRLFVSYAHADEKKLKPLFTHLTILGSRGYIQPWDDTRLIAGEEWEKQIIAEMMAAKIVLLIYSSESRASEFIQKKEAPLAVELRHQFKCTLIVVPLDRKDWDMTLPLERELKKLQTATWNAKPVLNFTPQRDGWQEVEHAIRKAVEVLRFKQ